MGDRIKGMCARGQLRLQGAQKRPVGSSATGFKDESRRRSNISRGGNIQWIFHF